MPQGPSVGASSNSPLESDCGPERFEAQGPTNPQKSTKPQTRTPCAMWEAAPKAWAEARWNMGKPLLWGTSSAQTALAAFLDQSSHCLRRPFTVMCNALLKGCVQGVQSWDNTGQRFRS